MQLTVLIAAFAAVSVSASPSWLPGNNQVVVNEDFKVPGDNPLYFCSDPKDYIAQITKVDLSPNPPLPGKTLSIKASGDVTEDIEEGSKIHITVKYGLITLINQDADFCETVQKADLQCPIKKGDLSVTKDVDIPKEVPPGTYHVLADVYTKDNKKITCLTSTIAFRR